MAGSFVFANGAVSALQSGISQFSSTAYINVDDVDRFPELVSGSRFPIILTDREDNFEICYVTALTESGEMTLERAQEGTQAQSWTAGTSVEHTFTAGTFLSAARLVPKGEWDEAANYIPGDVVVYTDISYLATEASLNQVPSAGSDYWQVLYVPPGVTSTALNLQGDWNSGTTYAIGAMVKYQGRWAVAIAATTGNLPTDPDYWYTLTPVADPTYFDAPLTTTGAINNYVVNPTPAPAALYDGMTLSVIFTNTNTAPATLTIGALAPTPLRPKKSTEFAAGEIIPNTLYKFTYVAGSAELIAQSAPVFEKKLADAALRYVPAGAVLDYAGATAPTGFLLCYGQVVSRTTYAALFLAIGTAYNTGGEAGDTFRLPDYRGRVGVGKDDMGGVAAGLLGNVINGTLLGAKAGLERVTMLVTNLASHAHTIIVQNSVAHEHGGVTGSTGNHDHGGNTGNPNNNPTYDRASFSTTTIKEGTGTDKAVVSSASNTATNLNNWTHSHTIGGSGDHAHSLDDNPGGIHSHVATAENTGDATPMNNLQPSIITNKIICTGVA